MRDLIHGQCWVLSVFTYSHRSFLAVLRLVSGLRIPEEKNSLYVEGTKWKISIREADVFSRGGASCIDHPIACGVRDWPPYISLYRSLTQNPPSAWSSRTRAALNPIPVVALGHVVKEGPQSMSILIRRQSPKHRSHPRIKFPHIRRPHDPFAPCQIFTPVQ